MTTMLPAIYHLHVLYGVLSLALIVKRLVFARDSQITHKVLAEASQSHDLVSEHHI
jgi:hypothetical protein